MMDLQLVNSQLIESRLYRNNAMGRRLTGEQVANLLYLNTLALWLLTLDPRTVKFARQYAKKTVGYGNYLLYRSTVTDLYALAYHVNNPDSHTLGLRGGEEYLNRLQFDDRMHHRMIREISAGKLDYISTYLFRLRTQIKIKDARYGSWRRSVHNWSNLGRKQQDQIAGNIAQEINRIARGSELLPELNRVGTTSTARKLATTAAGALVGHELARKTGHSTQAGTGLGAIAGYWAAK